MKTMRIYFLMAVVVLSSCSKRDDPAPTTAGMLSQNTWVLATLSSTDPDFQTTGQVLIGSEWSFKSDKSFSLYVNYSGLNMTFTGTWSMSSDNKKVNVTSNISGSPAASEMEIVSISASALQLKESDSGMVNTYTFTKK